jgi:hypothetical protein
MAKVEENMEVSRVLEINKIDEIKILSNVRVIHRHDLNPIYSKENLQVQFLLTGELNGKVTCYLCLDQHELSSADKNYLFPLFVEAMNILLGRQLSQDQELKNFNVTLSPPKLSMISKELNSEFKSSMQKYELELEGVKYTILNEYSLEAIN